MTSDSTVKTTPAIPRQALLAHYDEHKRDLPWRRTSDPYAIWVSEIMCQQTRVETVIPYYDRFLKRFPNAKALASASEDELMSHWSGLGYYRRARLLQAGAKEVVASYGGKVPKQADKRLALPGVGRYTAGAIGSIAFGLKEPIVDGNVARVLSRFHLIETPLGERKTEAKLWTYAEQWVEGTPRPGDLNQAIMELGASLCSKRSPQCGKCPLRQGCSANEAGKQEVLPIPKKKKKPKRVELVAVVARSKGKLLIARSTKKLFGGLWGLPMIEGRGQDAARLALGELGASARVSVEPLGQVRHLLSHRDLRVDVYRATHLRVSTQEDTALVTAEELSERGVAKLTLKCLDLEAT